MKNQFVALSIALMVSTAVFAQNNRSFVSTTGNDANACVPGSECRSFTRALAVTNAGGEVVALSSAGYGAFSVTRSVTVMASPGVTASLTVTSGDGIDIAAATTDTVVLRGLNVNATGPDCSSRRPPTIRSFQPLTS